MTSGKSMPTTVVAALHCPGLMAGSACTAPELLNNQVHNHLKFLKWSLHWGGGRASLELRLQLIMRLMLAIYNGDLQVPNRRLKLPTMYKIYHPAPAPPSANYAEPASPVPEEQYDAPPTASPPRAMENESTTTQKPDPGNYLHFPLQVNCMHWYQKETLTDWGIGNSVTDGFRVRLGCSDAPPTVNDMCGENQCVGMYVNKDTYLVIKFA